MNVVCNRCSAEYEFDDALVSRKGTTVKCTNCGHQFRVRLPEASGLQVQDRWIVRRGGDRQITFTNLRDLQQAIENAELDEDDTFSRDGRSFRRLGDVDELSAFFDRKTRPISDAPRTPPPPFGQGERHAPEAVPLSSPERITLAPGARSTRAERTVSVPSTPFSSKAPAPRSARATPFAGQPRLSPQAETASAEFLDRVTPDMTPPPARPFAADPGVARRARRRGVSGPEPSAPQMPPALPVRGGHGGVPPLAGAFQAATPPPSSFPGVEAEAVASSEGDRMSGYGSFSGRLATPSMPPPKSVGVRWIVGILLLGSLGLVAGTLGRKYLAQFASGSSAVSDSRLDAFLQAGHAKLVTGDLDAARAQFDRATGVNDTSPQVLEARLALAVATAEQEWLRARLLTPGAGPMRVRVQAELKRRLASLSESLAAAESASINKNVLGLARIDNLRMGDKLPQARATLSQLELRTEEPAVSYSLAALDLVETSPDFELVTQRLRRAAADPLFAWRAQTALVYVLGRSGDLPRARAELRALAESFPGGLALELGHWLDGLESQAVESEPEPEVEPATAQEAPRGKGRAAIDLARAARASGDWAAAERLYRKAVQQNPSDPEALTGLGDAARARGNTAAAQSHYGAVLRIQANYAPALRGYADIAWAQGDKSEAVKLYNRLIQQGAANATVKQRVAEFTGTGDTAASPGEPTSGEPPGEASPSAETAPAADPPSEAASEPPTEPTPTPAANEPDDSEPSGPPGPEPKAVPQKPKGGVDAPSESPSADKLPELL